MTDPWDEMSDHELEALRRAEEKFKVIRAQDNPYEHLRELAAHEIFRVKFFAYSGADAGDAGPIVIHADRTRIRPLISVCQTMWLPEIEEVVGLVIQAERIAREGGEEPEELEWNLQSFGLRQTPESYIVGYGETSSPLVLNKKMLLQFLAFVMHALGSLEEREGRDASLYFARQADLEHLAL